jgi:hypothetical protein
VTAIESFSGPQGIQIQVTSTGDPTVHITTCFFGSVFFEGPKMTQ